MIYLRSDDGCSAKYMTPHSAGADIVARTDVVISPGTTVKVPTGIWIAGVEWSKVPENMIPELQIRARSSLAYKKQLILTNGVGTVDADYPDEICVLLTNLSKEIVTLVQGERVAQIVLNLVHRFPNVTVQGDKRMGGFGSTNDGVRQPERNAPSS